MRVQNEVSAEIVKELELEEVPLCDRRKRPCQRSTQRYVHARTDSAWPVELVDEERDGKVGQPPNLIED
jgi:hypothetical protein